MKNRSVSKPTRNTDAPVSAPESPGGRTVRSEGTARLSSGEGVLLVAILSLGLLLRLLYLAEAVHAPDFDFPAMDAWYKDYWARGWLTGKWDVPPGVLDPQIPTTPYLRPPGYSLFLALIYLVSGSSYSAVHGVQMALGVANILLMFFMGRRLFGPAVGLTAAFFFAVYWIFIFFEQILTEVTLVVSLLLVLFYLLLDWNGKFTYKRCLGVGLVVGFLVITRTETLLFVPVLLGWCLWAGWDSESRRRLLTQTTTVLAGVVLCIAPITLRNTLKTGDFVLICTIGGLNFYAGNNEEATGYFPDLDYRKLLGVSQVLSHNNFPQLLEALKRKTGNSELKHSDLERYFVREAFRYIRQHPLRTVQLALKKIALFWGPAEVTSNEVLYYEKRFSKTLRFLPTFPFAAGLFVLGLTTLFATRRETWRRELRERREPLRHVVLMLAFIFTSTLTYTLFFVVGRFRVPIIPFLLLIGAQGVVTCAGYWARGEVHRALRWGLVGVGAVLFFHIPFVPYEPDLVRYYFLRGSVLGQKGKTDEALAELLKGVQAGGNAPWLLSEVGFAYAVKGDHEKAVSWYARALERDPHNPDTRHRYALSLLRLGRTAEALTQLDLALQDDFTHYGARVTKAQTLGALGRVNEAEALLKETAQFYPNSPEIPRMLGDLYAQLQRWADASAAYERALALDPENAEVLNAIGYARTAMGEIDKGIEYYRQALRFAPRLEQAHVNLANALAEQGRYDEAIAHYLEALVINPESWDADYGWGWVCARQGKIEEAVQRFRDAVRKHPDHVEARNYLGYLLLESGDVNGAIAELEKAIETNPNHVTARNNLGDAYAKAGRIDEAFAQFRESQRINPNDEYSRKRLEELREIIKQRLQVQPGQKVLVF
jgi:tetratricopeptide (TPR) repeat protein